MLYPALNWTQSIKIFPRIRNFAILYWNIYNVAMLLLMHAVYRNSYIIGKFQSKFALKLRSGINTYAFSVQFKLKYIQFFFEHFSPRFFIFHFSKVFFWYFTIGTLVLTFNYYLSRKISLILLIRKMCHNIFYLTIFWRQIFFRCGSSHMYINYPLLYAISLYHYINKHIRLKSCTHSL